MLEEFAEKENALKKTLEENQEQSLKKEELLKKESETLQSAVGLMKQNVNKQSEENQSLRAEIEALSQGKLKLEKQLEDLLKVKGDMERSSAEAMAETAQNLDKILNLEKQVREIKGERDVLHTKCTETEAKLESAVLARDEAEAKLSQLIDENANAASKLQSLEHTFAASSENSVQQLAQAKASIEQLQSEIKAKDQSLASAQQKHQEQLSQLKVNLAESSASLENQKNSTNILVQEWKTKLDTELQLKDAEMEILRGEIDVKK